MIHRQLINKIKLKLKDPLPGEDVQYLMAPVNRGKYNLQALKKENFKPGAVMIVICIDEAGNFFIPLTQRYTYDGAHSGQVSLPGGKFDDADINLTNTALRECYEEIGIAANQIEILGCLSPLFIPVSKFLVQPVVGFCGDKNISFKKDKREVKKIVRLFLTDLMNEKINKRGLIEIKMGEEIKAPYFEVEGLSVWGATAMILNEFKFVLKTIWNFEE